MPFLLCRVVVAAHYHGGVGRAYLLQQALHLIQHVLKIRSLGGFPFISHMFRGGVYSDGVQPCLSFDFAPARMRINPHVLHLIGPSQEYASPDWIQAVGLVTDIPKRYPNALSLPRCLFRARALALKKTQIKGELANTI